MAAPVEAIIDPDLPIIDPHHHLWDRSMFVGTPLIVQPEHPFQRVLDFAARYLLDEFLNDTNSGHNIKATVFLECHSMLKAEGEPETRYLGETQFVNGVAAMSASGVYGPTKVCAGIVGNVPLETGARAGALLDQHIAAGGGRFRGVRNAASWDADAAILGPISRQPAGRYLDPKFREGFAELGKRGLSFDAWLLEPQLPDLIDLARAFPQTPIVLDHVGTPLGLASYKGKREERFDVWAKNIRELATCPNVYVKLGGLAMDCTGFDWWCFDQFVHGDVGSGCFHVHDCLDVVHGDWSDEWDELHVHGDCDECVRNWFGLNGLCVDRSFDGAGCTDFGFGDFECEWSVGCVVDCTGVEWWCFDQFVLGDVFAGFVHVYERNNLVHGDGSDEWDELYVHGDCDECVR
jgi:predicted TIM-barrel fold metal-dependent hydrolase